jgi:hypothetical protein
MTQLRAHPRTPPLTVSDRPFVRPRPSRLRVEAKHARTDERGRSRTVITSRLTGRPPKGVMPHDEQRH